MHVISTSDSAKRDSFTQKCEVRNTRFPSLVYE